MLEPRELVLVWYWTGIVAAVLLVSFAAVVGTMAWEWRRQKSGKQLTDVSAFPIGAGGAFIVLGIPALCVLGSYLVGHYFG